VFAALANTPNNVEQAICFLPPATVDPCNNNSSVTVPGLTPGTSYSFWVVEGNANGYGTGIGTNPVTLPSGCSGSATYCVNVDATQTHGAATGRAAGLLESVYQPNLSRVQPLAVTNWRVDGPVTSWTDSCTPKTIALANYQTAATTPTNAGAAVTTTVVLSNAWWGTKNGYAPTPWSNWACYDTFVQTYVSLFESEARQQNLRLPDYWEPQNEPDDLPLSAGYFSASDAPSATLSNVELLFQHAYTQIHKADALAKTLGPSLDGFAGYPGQRQWVSTPVLDLATFLNYSDGNALKWDAISWHENNSQQNTDWTDDPEEDVANHVTAARTLLSQHATLGSPKIVINEYGAVDRWEVPGWQAGNIAGMEAAGVDFASHSCFSTKNLNGPNPTNGNCFASPSTLDGLVGTDGSTPYAIWWADQFYGAMSYDSARAVRATVVSSSSSSPNVGAFATREDATSTVSVLVGRNESCLGGVTGGNQDCASSANPPSAVNVPLTVTFPYAAPNGVRVDVRQIPFPNNNAPAATAPLPGASTVNAVNGKQVITLLNVADGDAWSVTLSPA
jgi:hypothetical protein